MHLNRAIESFEGKQVRKGFMNLEYRGKTVLDLWVISHWKVGQNE